MTNRNTLETISNKRIYLSVKLSIYVEKIYFLAKLLYQKLIGLYRRAYDAYSEVTNQK